MHLTRIRLGGVPPFTEPIDLKFDPRINVFIGPNASGKSTLLQAIAERFLGQDENAKRQVLGSDVFLFEFPEDEFDEYLHEEIKKGVQPNLISASEDWFGTSNRDFRPEVPPAIVYIGSVREGLPGISDHESLEEYGDTSAEALAEPFSGSSTMRASLLLGKERWSDEEDGKWYPKRGSLLKAIEIAGYCSKQICDEVIRESRLRNYIPGPDVRGYLAHPFAGTRRITVLSLMGVDTTDKRNYGGLNIWEKPSSSAYKEDPDSLPIYLGHLSSGTQGTLLWILWLSLKLVQHYDFEQGWEKKPVILLIDEIENHLHPTWQRRVIPALLEHFPGLQIFATTHSPFVVAGLEAGQVHVLKRDGNGVVTASTNERDVVGWTADEILRGMMGVDEPTDQLTVDRANRLRQLRDKDVLNEAEEEELNQLRRQVNNDLLSKGGLLESQRERYADLVQDFLRMRQSELTQDGE